MSSEMVFALSRSLVLGFRSGWILGFWAGGLDGFWDFGSFASVMMFRVLGCRCERSLAFDL